MATTPTQSPKRQMNIRLDENLLAALQEAKDRHGTPAAEAVRRGLRMWLASEGVTIQPPARAERRDTQTIAT